MTELRKVISIGSICLLITGCATPRDPSTMSSEEIAKEIEIVTTSENRRKAYFGPKFESQAVAPNGDKYWPVRMDYYKYGLAALEPVDERGFIYHVVIDISYFGDDKDESERYYETATFPGGVQQRLDVIDRSAQCYPTACQYTERVFLRLDKTVFDNIRRDGINLSIDPKNGVSFSFTIPAYYAVGFSDGLPPK